VCLDFRKLETSKGGFENVLVITDHFTRYAQAIPTRNQTAKTTANALFSNFIIHYGIPKTIHTDQGANFESHLIHELCQITGITKSRTTRYHPMGNGLCERFNRIFLKMFGTLQSEQKADWKKHIGPIVNAYNCMKQSSTGQSPFYLMFGREPRLPINLVFKTNPDEDKKRIHDRICCKSKKQIEHLVQNGTAEH
jgi:transposase InsO family protein